MSLTPYTLLYPITRTFRDTGGAEREETTSELQLRRIRGGDLRALKGIKDDMESGLLMIERLANIDRKTCDLLDAEDIGEISKLIESFAPGGQTTGKEA